MKIEQLPTDASSNPEIDRASQALGHHGDSIIEGKWLGMGQQKGRRNKASVSHIVMIWAKCHKIFEVITATFFPRNNVMNGGDVRKSANDAFPSITNPRRHFPRSRDVALCSSSKGSSMAFLRAGFGTEAHPLVFQHGWSHLHQFPTNPAWMLQPIVKRMQAPCSGFSEFISAFARAILPVIDVRASLKGATALLTAKTVRALPSSSAVVTRNEPLPLVGILAASAFAFR